MLDSLIDATPELTDDERQCYFGSRTLTGQSRSNCNPPQGDGDGPEVDA